MGGEDMINVTKLKGKLKERGLTQAMAAEQMGIDPATFNRKINNSSGETLTVNEVTRLALILRIPTGSLAEYFFAEKLAETQEYVPLDTFARTEKEVG